MRLKRIPAAIAAAGAIAACSAGPVQTSLIARAKPDRVTAHQVTARPDVAPPIGSNGPAVGVNLYAVHNYSAAQTVADGTRTLAYIKDDLHASAVDIVWNMYAPNDSSDSVVTKKTETLPASDIGILTRIAQQDGLSVEYRPMMFVETTGNSWEGLIKPVEPGAWFNSYYEANLLYLQMAQKYHINEYVIGSEMNGLSPDPQWPVFLAKAAEVFTGQISFTANDNVYFPQGTQLPPTQLTGVDMYEKLRLLPSASLSEVVAAYEKFFAGVPASLLERTAIQETGIQARAGAYGDPPNLERPGELDETVQYNWFMAGCETVKRFHLRGIFFWKVDLADHPVDHPASSLSTFEGKTGAMAISKCASIING
jgi:glycosyl hydrolase family 113